MKPTASVVFAAALLAAGAIAADDNGPPPASRPAEAPAQSAMPAALPAPAPEAGWLRAVECLAAASDTVVPPGGLGSLPRLRVSAGGRALLRDQDYRILPGDSALLLAAPPEPGDSICVDRAWSPLLADPVLRLYRLDQVPVFRQGSADTGAWAATRAPGAEWGGRDSLGAYRLNYSGSKSMAVTLGSGGGLGLDAALYVELEGQVAENVFIEGQLSDQNVPVQPEGNTATLKEVDTKFMRVYGRNYAYVLGKYLLEHGDAGEDAYRAKVEGVEASYLRGENRLQAAWSRAEGQYASDTLRGVDGKQRGYYLRGRDGRQFITVLAGTERIWRNGAVLRRGVDYVIDYSEGRVDFLNTLVVTSENLFSAEFQYTDQDYARTLTAGTVEDTAGAFTWSLRAISEGENPDQPLSASFDQAQRARFAGLGDTLLVDSLGRPVAMPSRQSAAVAKLGFEGGGNASRATLLLSEYDRNLFSSRDDGDNAGYSTIYRGRQLLGRPIDQGGFGGADIRFDHEYRSDRYRSFKQLIEPRAFLETWNLDASVAGSGFLAHRLRIEEQPLTGWILGAEAGRAETVGDPAPARPAASLEPGSPVDAGIPAAPDADALSRRGVLSTRIGGETSFLEASTEAKLARDPGRRDNYRQAARAQLEASGLIPSAAYVRNEWLTLRPDGRLAQSIKQEPEMSLGSRPLLGHLVFATGASFLSWRGNFDGRLSAVRDSVRDWGFSQRLEVLALGPWTADAFYSFRDHREWRLDPLGRWAPDAARSEFHQVEWDNHLSDHRRGYGLVTTYRVSQTAELPLVEDFEEVPAGRGDYVKDSLGGYHEVETGGNFVLIGLQRDTTLGSRPYQDLSFTANLELVPGRFPFAVKGVLADLELLLDMAFDHQDTSGSASLLPRFTDAAIEEARSGRSRYSPSLRWKGPEGRKSANLRLDRSYALAAGIYASRDRRLLESADWRQSLWDDWEYSLEQAYESQDHQGLTASAAGGSESETWSYGTRLLRRLPYSFSLEGRAAYETVTGSSLTGGIDLQGLRPALKLEKTSLFNGRAFLEYGLIYYWGMGQGDYYATDGYLRGLTHRMQANSQFQVGEHMHLNFDYVVRLEPGASSPSQKLTAEARAVF